MMIIMMMIIIMIMMIMMIIINVFCFVLFFEQISVNHLN